VGLVACSTLPEKKVKQDSNYLQNYRENTYLEQKLSPLVKKHPKQTGFFLLENGLDAFAVRTALIKKAESKIDIQYYMIHEDKSGRAFFSVIKQAADRGVKIRLLIDDIHLDNESSFLKDVAAHPNIEVRVFNPFDRRISRYPQFAFRLGKITRRMHNKSLTIDNQISIVGGRNIADEYFQLNKEVNFGDVDAVFIGPLVQEVSKSFDDYWNSEEVELLANLEHISAHSTQSNLLMNNIIAVDDSYYIDALDKQAFPFSWANAQLIADKPEKIHKRRDKKQFIKETELYPYIQAVKKEILIFTPYLVPTDVGIQHIKQLRKRGIKVTFVTNSLATTDVPFVHAGYMNYRKKLINLGVNLYELKKTDMPLTLFKAHAKGKKVRAKKGSLHAKLIVFDREVFYVGSMNIDPRSIYENTELGLVIQSPDVSELIYQWFEKNVGNTTYKVDLKELSGRGETLIWRNSKKSFLIKEPRTRLLGRIWMDFLSGLPIAEKHL